MQLKLEWSCSGQFNFQYSLFYRHENRSQAFHLSAWVNICLLKLPPQLPSSKISLSVRTQTRCQVLVKCFSLWQTKSFVISWNFPWLPLFAHLLILGPHGMIWKINTLWTKNYWSTIYSKYWHLLNNINNVICSGQVIVFWLLNRLIRTLLMHKSSRSSLLHSVELLSRMKARDINKI